MTSGTPFGQIVMRLRAEARNKLDAILVPSQHVELVPLSRGADPTTEVGMYFSTPDLKALDGVTAAIAPFAHTQISEHCNIPRQYYALLQNEDPGLLISNIAGRWGAKNNPRLIRTIRNIDIEGGAMSVGEPRVRAFLGNTFRVLDNLDFATTVLEEAEAAGAEIISAHLDGERFYMKLTTPRVIQELKSGDPVQAGVIVRNSEVGDGRVLVQPWGYRLICSNGMTAPMDFGQVHLGSKLDYGILQADTVAADAKSIWLQVRDWVRWAFSQDNLSKIIEALQGTQEVKVEKARAAVANIVKRYELSQNEANGVLDRFLRANDDTGLGLVNALTEFAHTEPMAYRRQCELEGLGGRIAFMDTSSLSGLLNPTNLSDAEVSKAFGLVTA